jgi:XTP/dITP diphosphohydrolase
VRALLPAGYPLLSLADIGCTVELPETSDTLEGNARQKAEYVCNHFGVDCFADDTGLEVEPLQGAPGVFSARYAGLQRDDQANCAKLLQELQQKTSREARFRTVICLIQNSRINYFEGKIAGDITMEPRGSEGFGYDPIFQPDGADKTFAQMSFKEKNKNSHRGLAVKKLVQFLNTDI